MKFELLEVASTDERLRPGEFRFLSRLLKYLDKKTWTASVGDERMIAEVPQCGDSSVCNSHRKALASHGWLTYEPGSGKRTTVYRFPQEPPYDAIMKLDARQRALSDRREERGFRPQIRVQTWATNQPRGGRWTRDSLYTSHILFPGQSFGSRIRLSTLLAVPAIRGS